MLIFEGSITERTSSGECLQVIYKDDRVSGPSGLLHFTTSPSEGGGTAASLWNLIPQGRRSRLSGSSLRRCVCRISDAGTNMAGA